VRSGSSLSELAAKNGLPEPLFRCPVHLPTAPTRAFDLLPDGRFIMVGRADEGAERSEIYVTAGA
jgi:hypothetical protein